MSFKAVDQRRRCRTVSNYAAGVCDAMKMNITAGLNLVTTTNLSVPNKRKNEKNTRPQWSPRVSCGERHHKGPIAPAPQQGWRSYKMNMKNTMMMITFVVRQGGRSLPNRSLDNKPSISVCQQQDHETTSGRTRIRRLLRHRIGCVHFAPAWIGPRTTQNPEALRLYHVDGEHLVINLFQFSGRGLKLHQ
jgi:hypothetical protein